jgi:OmpA-like transmembrane domain
MTIRWPSAAWTDLRRVVLGVLVSALTTAALAADPGSFPNPYSDLVGYFRRASGFYLNLDLGAAKYPDSIDVGAPSLILKSVDSRTVDTAWGLAFGWRFTPYFASEAGYADLGGETVVLTGGAATNAALGNARLAIRGPTVAFIGSIPFDAWEGYVKVGYLFSDADLSFSGSNQTRPFGPDSSRTTPAPFAALGALYKFDDRWFTKLEVDHYQSVGYDSSNGTDTISVNVVAVGVGLRF